MAKRDNRILEAPEPRAFVENLTTSGLLLNLRLWAKHENVGELQRVIVEEGKSELEASGIETLLPQQVVRVVPPDSDPSRLLSSMQPMFDGETRSVSITRAFALTWRYFNVGGSKTRSSQPRPRARLLRCAGFFGRLGKAITAPVFLPFALPVMAA
jgi:hypothetical protein